MIIEYKKRDLFYGAEINCYKKKIAFLEMK